MNNTIVEIIGVSKQISGENVLDNISIAFERGKVYGIVGKNGSGKSMFFKSICGLVNISQGKIRVFGEVINNCKFPKDTGIIIENPGFLPNYSAFRNLKYLANIRNIINDEDIKNVINLVGLDANDNRPLRKYSLGMKQRLGIAQAIMEKPKLLILDEPMNALDEQGVKLTRNIILDLKKNGTTVLLTSHNREDIDTLCDYIYSMECGKLNEES